MLRQDEKHKIVVLEAEGNVFCSGMDFNEICKKMEEERMEEYIAGYSDDFLNILKQLVTLPKVVISNIRGSVMAGGVGIIAASDLVIASNQAQFGLPEAFWGLVPAIVIPFIIRRTGFQNAYKMALTTMTVSAKEAFDMKLIDIISEYPEVEIRNYSRRVSRLEIESIHNMKQYFHALDGINQTVMSNAVQELSKLLKSKKVIENIRDYNLYNRFPWEK